MIMETKDKKSRQRISAGQVVVIEYLGENRPCHKCMGLLLSPLKGEGEENLRTVFAIDFDTHTFLPAGPLPGGGKANVEAVRDRKTKAMYFERVNELLDEGKEG